MNIQQAKQYFIGRLASVYDKAEAANIAEWVLESVTGLSFPEQRFQYNNEITAEQSAKLDSYLSELWKHRPVQYVLGESYFGSLKLYVDENVLIPRPETEELVDWTLKYCRAEKQIKPVVLDIGTGSGCIPLSLKQQLTGADVSAIDISEKALQVARKNAGDSGLRVNFILKDILNRDSWEDLPTYDIIISNPPYITLPEKESILPNVLLYEPHQALFVTNEDPLQFYKAIEAFAADKLVMGGAVFLELHRDFARDTVDYYKNKNWTVELRQDMQGNDRMLMARRY